MSCPLIQRLYKPYFLHDTKKIKLLIYDFPTLFVNRSPRISIQSSYFFFSTIYLLCQIEFQLFIIITSHLLQMDNANRSRVRIREDKKNCKARVKYCLMQDAKAMGEENLKTYNSWLLPDKLAFAMNNYRFPNNPGDPAVEVFQSTIRMSEGMSRGIKVGEALPYLPKNFVLALAWHSIVDIPSTDPIQSCYQVIRSRERILLLESSILPDHSYGLGNLVKAAISCTNRNST